MCDFSTGPLPCGQCADQWVRLVRVVRSSDLSPIRRGFKPGCVNYKKCALDSQPQVYQLLVNGPWFSPGIPASSTTKIDRHDIAEILLKVVLKHQNSKSINLWAVKIASSWSIFLDLPFVCEFSLFDRVLSFVTLIYSSVVLEVERKENPNPNLGS